MNLYYKCSDGTVFDLMDGDITCESPESLVKRKWKYKTVSAVNGFNRIKQFYKESEELPLKISVLTDTEAEFNDLMMRLSLCFDKDIQTLKPGRIYWNGWYREVFCIISEPSNFEDYLASIEQKLTLLCLYDYWIKEKKTIFSSDISTEFNLNADYPYEFGDFEYMPTDYINALDSDSVTESHFELIFFGPCSNPYVIIGDNDYRLKNCQLADGEYIVINSKNRTIQKHLTSGENENVFYLRNDNDIFKKIPAGKSIVTKSANTEIQITNYIERGEPIWI